MNLSFHVTRTTVFQAVPLCKLLEDTGGSKEVSGTMTVLVS